MDTAKMVMLAIDGLIAGWLGYIAYVRSGTAAAVAVVFTASLLLYLFSSVEKGWNSLKLMTNPFWATVLGFLVGMSHASLKGMVLGDAVIFGLGTALLGGAAAMFVYKYWNIA